MRYLTEQMTGDLADGPTSSYRAHGVARLSILTPEQTMDEDALDAEEYAAWAASMVRLAEEQEL